MRFSGGMYIMTSDTLKHATCESVQGYKKYQTGASYFLFWPESHSALPGSFQLLRFSIQRTNLFSLTRVRSEYIVYMNLSETLCGDPYNREDVYHN